MQANPVILVPRQSRGDGRLSSTKTYQRPRLVAHSLTAGHPTEMHYAISAGPISTGKMSQAKESFFTAEVAECAEDEGRGRKEEKRRDAE